MVVSSSEGSSSVSESSSSSYRHEEKVFIEPIVSSSYGGEVNVALRFKSAVSFEENMGNVGAFPIPIVNLLMTHAVERLSIRVSSNSFSSTDDWRLREGLPTSFGPGTSIHTRFFSSSSSSPNKKRLPKLWHSMVGMHLLSTAPLSSNIITHDDNREYRAAMPVEGSVLCNIHFIRQLLTPCRNESGLSQLMNAELLLAAAPHNLSRNRRLWIDMSASPHCFDNNNDICRMDLAVGVAYTVVTPPTFSLLNVLSRNNDNNDTPTKMSTPFRSCPLSHSTTIDTILAYPQVEFSIPPSDTRHVQGTTTTVYTHDFHALDATTMKLPWVTSSSSQQQQHHNNNTSPLEMPSIQRTISRSKGVSNFGTIDTFVRNGHKDRTVVVDTLDIFPHFLIPIWHTFSVRQETFDETNIIHTATHYEHTDLIHHHNLRLHSSSSSSSSSLDGSSTTLSLDSMVIPPNSTLILSIVYHPKFLSLEQFPPDANYGMTLPPSMVSTTFDDETTVLYSNAVLLMPPVPDMSMPFNVISLTCTLYAFVIGTMMNLLIRKSCQRISDTLHPKKKRTTKLQKWKENIIRQWKKRWWTREKQD